ncbi:MAG: hypothetical protein Q9216_001296 [Gyalolechia sp. 2 TL-2023]
MSSSNSDSHTAPATAKEDGMSTSNFENEKAVAVDNDESKDPAPPRNVHGLAWFLVVMSILMANFLFATDNTVAANIQPAVVQAFASLDKLVWLPVAFFMSSWGTDLLWGDVYARFSSKWTFCAGFVVFAVGCAVCGAAPTMNTLIAGRAICGVGGAGMYFGSVALLTQLTSDRERPLYMTFINVTFGGGTVLGPIIGGLFAVSSASWRWAFYFNLVVGAVCAPVYIFLLPTLNPRPGESIRKRAKEIDYLGNILLCGFIIAIVMPISFGGIEYAWNSGSIIAPFVMAFVLLPVFLAQQYWAVGTAPDRRVFPMHFLKSATMPVLFVELACAATCVFVPVYFLPLYFQFVKADTATIAGLRMLPLVFSQSLVAVFSGWLVGKTGYYVPVYIFAGTFCVAGAALLYTVNQYTSLANVYGYQVLMGLGSGASTQLSFAVASMKVAPADVPRSTGWEAFAQLGGPTIALSIANSVFLNKGQRGVGNLLPDRSTLDISTIISDPNSELLRDLPENVQHQVIDVVVESMSNAYILCIVAGCFILLLIFRFRVNSKLYG